jgi:DnaJ-class molecular chaperone
MKFCDKTRQEVFWILKLKGTESKDEIRRAFLYMTKLYHPDINGGTTDEIFFSIREAYDILMNVSRIIED